MRRRYDLLVVFAEQPKGRRLSVSLDLNGPRLLVGLVRHQQIGPARIARCHGNDKPSLSEFCRRHQIGLACYWVLMKGLLAGHLKRDHQFDLGDRRLTYDIFRGPAWQRNQDLLDQLREIAAKVACSVSQLVIAWTLAQPPVTVALCGAKRPDQVVDNAHGMQLALDPAVVLEIDDCIARRGRLV